MGARTAPRAKGPEAREPGRSRASAARTAPRAPRTARRTRRPRSASSATARCTSPASSSVRPPPASSTIEPGPRRRRPPRARAGAPGIARPRSASRSRQASSVALGRLREAPLERPQQRRQHRLDLRALAAQRRGLSCSSRAAPRCAPRRSARSPARPSPPAGAPSARMPASLPRGSPPRTSTTSLGHLIRARSPADVADGERRDQRQQRRWRSGAGAAAATSSSALPAGADQRRPWRPRPARLLGGGDERPVRRARQRELARAVVRRVGAAQVDARPTKPRRPLVLAHRSPRRGVRVARAPARRRRRRGARPRRPRATPRSRSVSLVIGPIETTRVCGESLADRARAGCARSRRR